MKLTFTVPKRDGFEGYWVLQKFFETGTHEVDVSEEQAAELKADPIVKVGEPAAPAAEAAPEAPPSKPGKPFKK